MLGSGCWMFEGERKKVKGKRPNAQGARRTAQGIQHKNVL
jgi:hypothetical protein